MTSPHATPASFKVALGRFASGVTVVTGTDPQHRPWGMTATAFSSVSADPPTVLICVNRSTRTHDLAAETGHFGVNILGASGLDVSNFCARPGSDKYLDGDWLLDGPWTSPGLRHALAFLDCRVEQRVEAGTHSVFIGSVENIVVPDDPTDDTARTGDPLVYWCGGYRTINDLETADAR